jgi:ribonuclease-3 family protein
MLCRPLTEDQIGALGVLAVASAGDSVYDLMVRTHLCSAGIARADDVHNIRVSYVNAKAQAAAAGHITHLLSAEESAVFRRGRNAEALNVPQAASRAEYHTATALEALFGWLWLSGRTDRLRELFEVIVNETA